jgi:LysR family nitrogen assimilation transcriptional regulator
MAIAEAGSLSRAAARLSISQPTLSRQLNRLETEMRTDLFYRHGRGVALTHAGQRLLDVAGDALQRLDGVRDELQSRTLDEIGEVAIGMPPSIAATVGADLATVFAATWPKAHLRMRESFSGVLQEWIETGRLDLAVLYDARRGPNTLATPLLLEDLFLIEAPGEPGTGAVDVGELAAIDVGELAAIDAGELAAIDVGELAARACLLPGPGNGLRRVVDAACWSERVQPRVQSEIDCVAALKQLVERGAGCTILPFGAVHREVQEGRLRVRPFRSPAMRAMLVLATPPNKPVTPLIRSVIGMLQTEVRRLAALGVLRGDTQGLGAWNRQAAPER